MFCETTYIAGTGKAYKEYLMNRDGFALLAMSFTGKKALKWKIKYIEAFNAMEKTLKQQSPSYLLEDPIERAKRWIEEQQAKQQAIKALEEAKPKVETYDKLISNEGYVGLREMAKMLNYPVNKMGAYILEIGMDEQRRHEDRLESCGSRIRPPVARTHRLLQQNQIKTTKNK